MAVPRNRHSNARKNTRRAHHAKSPKHLAECTNCKSKKMPHCICQACGYYGDREVIAKSAAEE